MPEKPTTASGYLHINQLFIRQIDAIEGDTVIYYDQYGSGRCGRRAFLKTCPTVDVREKLRFQPPEVLFHGGVLL